MVKFVGIFILFCQGIGRRGMKQWEFYPADPGARLKCHFQVSQVLFLPPEGIFLANYYPFPKVFLHPSLNSLIPFISTPWPHLGRTPFNLPFSEGFFFFSKIFGSPLNVHFETCPYFSLPFPKVFPQPFPKNLIKKKNWINAFLTVCLEYIPIKMWNSRKASLFQCCCELLLQSWVENNQISIYFLIYQESGGSFPSQVKYGNKWWRNSRDFRKPWRSTSSGELSDNSFCNLGRKNGKIMENPWNGSVFSVLFTGF